jgi:hypothetical protein|tara:strand:+ start:4606 stop:5031 length:426 start_codon:yes stop_codon:yes gene_type:complete
MSDPLDIFDNIEETEVHTYHLTDGSYIIAEEVDFEEENNVIYIVLPARLERTSYGFKFGIYTIGDIDDVTELNTRAIVTRTEAPFALKVDYLRYIIANKLRKDKLEEELDAMEEESKLYDAFDSIVDKPYKNRLDWKPENN